MANIESNPKQIVRRYRGPVTVNIETVRPTPTEKDLPPETHTTVNIKGDDVKGRELIAEIERQLAIMKFFSVTVDGPS